MGGQLFDQVDDLGDLQRPIAEALDLLGDDLHLAADALHAGQAIAHRLVPLTGGLQRVPGRAGRLLGGAGDLAHGAAHRLHGVADGRDLARLGLGAAGHLVGGADHLVRAAGHAQGRVPNVGQQGGDLLDHDVDGVDDAAEDVRRHLAAPREIALGDLHDRVEERLDVLLEILALLLLVVALGLGHDLRAQAHHGVVERVGQQADLVA